MSKVIQRMAVGAANFAENDIAVAIRMVNAGIRDGRGHKIRMKYATARLKSARQQLKAAIILLENDDDE